MFLFLPDTFSLKVISFFPPILETYIYNTIQMSKIPCCLLQEMAQLKYFRASYFVCFSVCAINIPKHPLPRKCHFGLLQLKELIKYTKTFFVSLWLYFGLHIKILLMKIFLTHCIPQMPMICNSFFLLGILMSYIFLLMCLPCSIWPTKTVTQSRHTLSRCTKNGRNINDVLPSICQSLHI